MNAGDEMSLQFAGACASRTRLGPRLRHRGRRLDQGRRLQLNLLADGPALPLPCSPRLQLATGLSRRRLGVSSSFAGLADLSNALRHAGGVCRRAQEPCKAMKRATIIRIFVTALFFALLAAPLLLNRAALERQRASVALNKQSAIARYGFYLQEISHAAGIDFVHQAPTLDPKLNHIMPQVASMGASVSVVDFDRDGWPDIYVTNSATARRTTSIATCTMARSAMSRQSSASPMSTGRAPASPWARSGATTTTTATRTCFLIKWGQPELFHNDGGKGFTRVSEPAGLATVGQRQYRGLVRLRPRRPARPLRRRLLPGERRPLALEEHAA